MSIEAQDLYRKMQNSLKEVYDEFHSIVENDNSDIRRVENAKQVTLYLKGQQSAQYTRLANKLEEIDRLSAQMKALKDEVKADTKDLIQDLFDVEDEAKTRIVDTISVIFTLSKLPAETRTPQYKAILEELVNNYLPQDLIDKVEKLRSTMVTVSQKSASLKLQRKESTNESFYLKEFSTEYEFPAELVEIENIVIELKSWASLRTREVDMVQRLADSLVIDVDSAVSQMSNSTHQLP